VTSKNAWKAWLLPGGALLVGAVALVNSPWLVRLAPSLDFYYFAVFASGLLLSWRFHSTRVMFSLLIVLLAQRAVEFFANGKVHSGPGHTAMVLVGLLVPLNFIVLAYMRERGLTISGVAPRLGLLFVQSVFVAVLCRPESAAMFQSTRDWTLPAVTLISFMAAASILGVRFFRWQKPLEVGFFWSLAGVFLWLRSPLGLAAEVYVATAGLILAVSLIETSYVLAYHDELTGIPGRRAFNEALLSLDQQYAIAIVDIDHFKSFNDTYGHDVGDQVLRMVASRLAAAGNGVQAYRCGGEEFAIIFRNTSARDAYDKLESLRQVIQNSTFRVRGFERRTLARSESDRRKPVRRKSSKPASTRNLRAVTTEAAELSVTVSMGVAEPSTRDRQSEQVIQAADQALYSAKGNGRNRVEMASTATPRASRSKRAKTAG
jgi:diguanylate cyclase (GGDEF)-like protein